MPRRIEYRLFLNVMTRYVHEPLPEGMTLRQPEYRDRALLAELMLNSYEGTIDYKGERLADALEEVEDWFKGRNGEALKDCSWLLEDDKGLAAVCLAGWWDTRECPIINFVMTRPDLKGSGLGSAVMQLALDSLVDKGLSEVRAMVTEGNAPSEKLCDRFGFMPVA